MCLWQALAMMAGKQLAPSRPNIKTSNLGGLQGGWLGLLFLLPPQAGGRNEFLPPSITAEGPRLGGGGRMQQEEDSPWFLSQRQRDIADPTG